MTTGLLERTVDTGHPIILVVDDEVDDLLLSERQLQPLGAVRIAVNSLPKAKAHLESLRVSASTARVIVVLDLMFPDDPEAGLGFLRQLVGQQVLAPERTFVIIHSAVDNPDVIQAALAAGAIEYTIKGDTDHLLRAVEYACGGDILVTRVLCHVISVDFADKSILVEMDSKSGWTAQRTFEFDWCPRDARFSGATFFADTFKRLGDHGVELVLKSSAVDGEADRRALRELLKPLE